jgi:hypothetical protein
VDAAGSTRAFRSLSRDWKVCAGTGLMVAILRRSNNSWGVLIVVWMSSTSWWWVVFEHKGDQVLAVGRCHIRVVDGNSFADGANSFAKELVEGVTGEYDFDVIEL